MGVFTVTATQSKGSFELYILFFYPGVQKAVKGACDIAVEGSVTGQVSHPANPEQC